MKNVLDIGSPTCEKIDLNIGSFVFDVWVVGDIGCYVMFKHKMYLNIRVWMNQV